MRASLASGSIAWHQLGWAFAINLIWLAAGFGLFVREFRHARVTGALVSIGE